MKKLITTAEAGKKLGVSASRIRQLVLAGELPAQKLGRDLWIDPKDLAAIERRPYQKKLLEK